MRNAPLPVQYGDSMDVDRHRSPLGDWTLARWTPPDLADRVEGVWCFQGVMALPRERHFPLGTLDLIVHLGPVYRHVQGERSDPFPRSCFSGLLLESDLIEAPPEPSAVLGIRLLPPGAWALLGRPLHELSGHTVELDDVLPGRVAALEDRLHEAPDPAARVRVAVRWLRENLGAPTDPDVRWVLNRIAAREGRVRIGDLQERSGLPRTALTDRFRAQVGVTPKRFARIARFRRALDLVRAGDLPLVEVALSSGYYDQPHLNREFREMSGFSPTAYQDLIRFPDSASVAEAVA